MIRYLKWQVPEPYNYKDILGDGWGFPLHKPYPKTAFIGEDSSILGTNEMFCCHLRCERIPRPNEWEKDISGQISIIPKPELRGFWGSSLIKPPFRVTSADVVIICPDIFLLAWNQKKHEASGDMMTSTHPKFNIHGGPLRGKPGTKSETFSGAHMF